VAEQLDFGWVYDLTPPATFRMLTRLELLTEEARYLDHHQHSILELRERDGLFRYVAQRQLDGGVGSRGPRFFSARPVLKETQVWQPANWDGSRHYDTVAEVAALAVTIEGGGSLTAVGAGGTRYTASLTVTSSGRSARKVETGIAESLAGTLQDQHAFRLSWLDRQPHNGF
jgi:hypothetical protein